MAPFQRIVFFSAVLVILVWMTGCSPERAGTTETQERVPSETTETSLDANDDPVTLTAMSGWEEGNPFGEFLFMFRDIVSEKSGGSIQIQFQGGPEAIPAFEQGEALERGLIDILGTATAFYSGLFPEYVALNYGEHDSSQELRDSGGWAYIQEIHEQRMNARILGHFPGMRYTIFTVNPVHSIEDFRGLTVRISPQYQPVVDALGMDAVTMPPGETYTAIERGVVDGILWPTFGLMASGLHEVLHYIIEPDWGRGVSAISINLDTWNELHADQQAILEEAILELEAQMDDYYAGQVEEETQALLDHGLQIIRLQNPEEYVQFIQDAAWEWIRNELPEHGQQLENYLRK